MKIQQIIWACLPLMVLLNAINLGAPEEVRFFTLNTWQEGTSVENGLLKIRDIIIETNADIICFTEVRNYNNEDWTTKIVDELESVGLDYYRGYIGGDVSIISKFPILSSLLVYEGEGSIAQFNVELANQNIIVACAHLDYTYYACYLPRGYNGGSPDWEMINNGSGSPDPVKDINYILNYNLLSTRDEQITSFINAINKESIPVILMGDFNEPSHLDWTENTKTMFDHNNMVIEWQSTQTLMTNGFNDAFRAFFPSETNNPGITWPSYVHGIGTTTWTPLVDERDRIDYIFYKGEGIIPTFASLVGPKESYANNEIDTLYTSTENFLASNLEWPSDHKGVLVTLQFQN
ncbi:MAG: endonuclease/exonuclease/phosphatase family protein [Lewinella sp.]|uniref:endonuclease/exonuclease/phosphatase family protein n=1 Tax=Lewinella sp. TaxID=2004506 RepID=UPI003D6AF77E